MSFGKNEKDHSWTDNLELKKNNKSLTEYLSPRFPKAFLRELPKGFHIRVSRDRAILVAGFVPEGAGPLVRVSPMVSPAGAVANQVRNMIYLPGLRGNPERLYLISAAGPQYPGSFNDYVASIIHRWGTTRDDRLKKS